MPQDTQSDRQSAKNLEVVVKVKMQYLLYLPKDYKTKEKWPLVLFLHGAGERGNNLEKVKVHGPPKLIEKGKDFPFVCVSPQCPKNGWWDAKGLEALLDAVQKEHNIDEDRVYVTGLSMGGFGTWSLASKAPKRFAAIAPICGGGDPIYALQLQKIPTWVFHGANDRVVPEARSKEMVEALKKRGNNVKYTVYAGAGHDSWTKTYDNPEFYKWLLAQKRSK